jgi:hypothetical protein
MTSQVVRVGYPQGGNKQKTERTVKNVIDQTDIKAYILEKRDRISGRITRWGENAV